ncbi:peptidoglycan DD-metalloendopeptidase family protein [Staphylococcus sp. 11261D007BR]
MKKLLSVSTIALSLGAAGFIAQDANASEQTEQPAYAQIATQNMNDLFHYGEITTDINGDYHHTLDGNWTQDMFDNQEYYFYLIDNEGHTHYFYFPIQNYGNQGAAVVNNQQHSQYEDNSYAANQSHQDVQAHGYNPEVNQSHMYNNEQSGNNNAQQATPAQDNTTQATQNTASTGEVAQNTANQGAMTNNTTDQTAQAQPTATQAPEVNSTNTTNASSNNVQASNNTQETTQTSSEAQSSSQASTNDQAATQSSNDNQTASSNWLSNYDQVQPYGQYNGGGAHYGVDYAMPENTPVYSLTDGTVVQSGWSNYGGGNQVTIQEENSDKYQWYMHMNSLNVQEGDQVQAGDQIGLSGSTGNSTGPHLHFQRMSGGIGNEYSVDPNPYINQQG